jgi:DNA polymerase III alpha subunit (gram-positive type)
MSYFVVDVEADGQAPMIGSMVCFGAVLVADMSQTFYSGVKPITNQYDEQALSISGYTRQEHLTFPEPVTVMKNFAEWIEQVNQKQRPIMITDNPAFDFAWINFYFWNYLGYNPFGWSARRIGDLFCGFMNNPHYKWKKHRKTKHTHNPVDDAKGNAEALWYLKDELGFNIKLI